MGLIAMAGFESDSTSIGGLFSGDNFFRIPNYQRPFSWDFDHFDDLINDTRLAKRDENYFLGTIVLHKDENNTRVVVDGQQRLTSLIILLACARDSIESVPHKAELQGRILQQERVLDGIPQRERLEVKDREIFNAVVLAEGGTTKLPSYKDLTEPQSRYVDACKAFHEALDAMSEPEKIEYVTFLNRNCILIFLMAGSFEEAFRLFEIVNDRGKQLRRIDVLKALNISPENVPQESVRDKIANKWEEAEISVGEDVFESIFFLLRLIVVKDKPQGDLLSEFKNRVFGKSVIKPGENFTDLLFDYVRIYRKIFIDRTFMEGKDENNRFQSLIFIMDSEFRASEWRACVLFFATKFGPENLYLFCLAIEKLFLTHWVGGVRKDERYSAYTKILTLIESSTKAENVIAETGGDLAAITSAVKSKNLYGTGYVKYVLLRLELAVAEFESPKLFSAKSIEHVHPQNPEAGGAWDSQATAEERSEFVNTCGNLVLLSRGRNSSAGNLEFDDKKVKYLSNRVTEFPRSVEVLGVADWTIAEIAARTQRACELVIQDP
jgi:uncharacterized protein with ParB-like and HNH nuclease domain